MGKYSDDLIRSLNKQVKLDNQIKQANREQKKAMRQLPSPSNSLKVADNSSAKSVNVNTGKTTSSPVKISDSKSKNSNLSDRGYSSSRSGEYAPKNSKFLVAQMGEDLAKYNSATIGTKSGSSPIIKSKAAKNQAEELKKKYGITDAELESANVQYKKDYRKNAAQKGVEQTEKFSQAHPVLGEAERALLTPFGSAEGVVNVIGAKMGRSANELEHGISDLKEASASGLDNRIADSNMSEGKKNVANMALGLGRTGLDLGVQAGASALTGVPMWGMTAGNAMNDYMEQATARGTDASKAADVAMGVGLIDALLQYKGLDEIAKASKVGKNAISTYGKSALWEGAEEGLQDISTKALDASVNWDNSQAKTLYDEGIANGLTPAQSVANVAKVMGLEVAQNVGGGALMGGTLGLLKYGKANGKIPSLSNLLGTPNNTEFDFARGESTDIPAPAPVKNTLERKAMPIRAKSDVDADITESNVNIPENATADNSNMSRREELSELISRTEDMFNSAKDPEERAFIQQDLDALREEANRLDLATAEKERMVSANNETLANNIVEATKGYDDSFDVKDIEERINNGDDIDDVIAALEDIADPDSMMPAPMAEKARAALDEIDNLYSDNYESNPRVMAEDIGINNNDDVVAELVENVDNASNKRLPVSSEIDAKMNEANTNNFGIKESSDALAADKSKPAETNTVANVKKRDIGKSDVVYNTAINSGVISEAESRTKMVKKLSEYEIHHESDTFNKAMARFQADAEKEELDFISGRQKIEEDSDVDTAMLCLTDIAAQEAMAKENGASAEELGALKARKYLMLETFKRGGTKIAQALQAFAKWNRTPEGSVMNANRILNDRVKPHTKAKSEKVSSKLLSALNAIVDDGTIKSDNSLTIDEIRQQVRNTLKKEFVSINKKFTDDDVDFIANLLNQGISKEDLSNAVACKLTNGIFEVSDETVKKVNDLFAEAEKYGLNDKQRVNLEEDAYSLLADEIYQNATVFEKFEAWRYLSMLGNPKTHIRNIFGNKAFSAVTGISNNLAAGLEEIASHTKAGKEMTRTKAFLNPTNKADMALIKGARKDANIASYRQLAGTKYNDIGHAIQANKNPFKSKLVRLLNEANNKALSAEDTSAMVKKYATSLAGYLKANGITDVDIYDVDSKIKNLEKLKEIHGLTKTEVKQLDNLIQKQKILEAGREYAIKQAEYSAFHEENKVAELLTKTSKELRESENSVNKILGYGIESLLPFKKTPANILRSGIDYSPAGLASTFKHIRNKADLSVVLEDLSKNITGTGIMALGYYLGNKGLININNKDQKYSNLTEGKQQYSVKIGNYTATIDFLVPSVMPLLVGANIANIGTMQNNFSAEDFYDALTNKNKGKAINQLLNAITPYTTAMSNIVSPIMETSMLSGLNDAIEELGQNGLEAGAGQLVANFLTGYASQGIPTSAGQLARTIDNTRRSTYTDQRGIAGVLDKKTTKVQNKLPFLSQYNEPFINSRGETQSNAPTDNIFGRAAYQFLSPTYIQKIDTTPAEAGSDALYDETVRGGAPDSKALINLNTSAEYDGQRLSKEDYTKWATNQGQTRSELLETLYNVPEYQTMDTADKMTLRNTMETLSKQIAMYNVKGKEGNSTEFNMWKDSGKNTQEFVKNYFEYNRNYSAAKSVGLTTKSGGANMDAYRKASDYYGDNTQAIQKYSDFYNGIYEKYGSSPNSVPYKEKLIPYLKDDASLTDKERGEMILVTKGLEHLAKAAQEAYNKNKDASEIWNYYKNIK